MSRPRLARALLLAAVAWSGAWAAVDLYRCVRVYQNRPWTAERPSAWRFGAAPLGDLAAFLAAAAPHLPAHGPVVLAYGEGPPEERFFGYLWAAYLLPRRLLVQPVPEPPGVVAWMRYGPGGPGPPAGARLRWRDARGEVWELP